MYTKFEEDLSECIESINAAISPYSHFVRSENERFERQYQKLTQIKRTIEDLKMAIDEMYSPKDVNNNKIEQAKTK